MRLKLFEYIFATTLLVLSGTRIAAADMIYSGNTVLDTTTGLIWQQGEIPTSTFIASGGWTVATLAQLTTLLTDAGSPGPYSPVAAQLGTWLSNNSGWLFSPFGTLLGSCSDGPAAGGNCFVPYWPLSPPYQVSGGSWSIVSNSTAASYGPTNALNTDGLSTTWDTEYVAALEVEVAPVPVPASAWLMLSGLGALAGAIRSKIRNPLI
jgi:hypothetical protein